MFYTFIEDFARSPSCAMRPTKQNNVTMARSATVPMKKALNAYMAFRGKRCFWWI
jgi:hypothetical protein